MEEISYQGCINMIVASIKSAIDDYQCNINKIDKFRHEYKKISAISACKRTKKETSKLSIATKRIYNFEQAELFLFNPNWLEAQIDRFGLDLNINYIRRKVTNEKTSCRNR